jgi:hypothetical protein
MTSPDEYLERISKNTLGPQSLGWRREEGIHHLGEASQSYVRVDFVVVVSLVAYSKLRSLEKPHFSSTKTLSAAGI